MARLASPPPANSSAAWHASVTTVSAGAARQAPRQGSRSGRAIGRPSQAQVPPPTDQGMSEAPVAFSMDEPEPGGRVDVSRRVEHAVGPERDLPVPDLRGEADTLAHQTRADAEAARLRLDQQEPQLGHRLGLLDEK